MKNTRKTIQYTKLNQSGMTAMLFAMVFIVILSLLAVGFASLVRNDQRQALDKSLSYQAQYAAETAINRIAQKLTDGSLPQEETTCQNDTVGDAKVTCITWTNRVDMISHDGLSVKKPFVTVLDSPSWGITGGIKLTWQTDGVSSNYGPSIGGLPTIDNSKVAILRLTLSNSSGSSGAKNYYIVPSSGGSGSINYNTSTNGSVVAASCNNASGKCTSGAITVLKGSKVSIVAYGPDSGTRLDISPTVSGQKLVSSQIEIDANARINEVTKRIIAKIDLTNNSWRPAFAVSARRMCKDFKVDGQQNLSASGASDPCPSSTAAAAAAAAGVDAAVDVPPSSLPVGASQPYPNWELFYSVNSSTIQNGSRARCTWQLLYNEQDTDPAGADWEVAAGTRTMYGTDCNDYGVVSGGTWQHYIVGATGPTGSIKCQSDVYTCDRPGYYNVKMYLYSYSGQVVGPRYNLNLDKTPRNSCRPKVASPTSPAGVCAYTP